MYQAMARRYRPQSFDDVIGQGHVARTLKNAITAGRVAHAYLFCGPHGCGKTSMARIFAKALNCTGGPAAEIPADCPIVADISSGQDPDVVEIDGASNNGVEQVRSLREQAAYVPARARFKIYIIDEVHMLSVAAFNALLKTLEEPPPHVKFILATTEPHKLLETVLSRCQRFDFRLVPAPEIATYLKGLCGKEGVPADTDALDAVAAFSGGSMRDALVLLDQLISFCPEGMTREDVERVRGVAGIEVVTGIFDAIGRHDAAGALGIVDSVSRMGTGAGEFLDQLIEYGRDLLRVCVTHSLDGVSAYGPARVSLEGQAAAMGLEEALLILDVFSAARVRVRGRSLSNPYVPLEMAVARLAGLEGIAGLDTALARIESIAQSGALSGDADVRLVPEALLQGAAFGPPAQSTSLPVMPGTETAAPAVQAAQATSTPARPVPKPTPPEPSPTQPERVPETASVPVTNPPAAPRESTPEATENAATDGMDAADATDDGEPLADEPSPAPLSADKAADPVTFLRQNWELFRTALRGTEPKDLGFFHDVFVLGCEDSCLVLRIPLNGRWLLEQLDEPARHARIEAAFSRVIGRPLTFRIVMEDAPAEDAGDSGMADDADDADETDSAEDGATSARPAAAQLAALRMIPPAATSGAKVKDNESLRARQRDAQRDEALQQLVTRFDAQILNIEDAPPPA